MSFATILALAAATQASPLPASNGSPLEIRFCPETKIWTHPLDSLRGVQSLLLQNVAIINRGPASVTLDGISIELRNDTIVLDERRLNAAQIDTSAKSASAAEAQGTFKEAAFQFCDGRLLGEARLADGPTLGPGQALVLMQHPFAFKGKRTDLAVTVTGTASGSRITAAGAIPLDTGTSKTRFRWPLAGKRAWVVGAGASFHTHHRWAVPEEFALDIMAVDGNGSTHRGPGASNSAFYAYGADVVAAADGMVVIALRGSAEGPPMLRKRGESMESYYGRIRERQAANSARGEAGISGDAVVIDHGNGEYSVYAHLVPGSVRVNAGDRVETGRVIGKLGSSGNSTEPHLHFHVCDRPSTLSCAGIPPTFVGIELPMADGPRPIQSGDLVRPE